MHPIFSNTTPKKNPSWAHEGHRCWILWLPRWRWRCFGTSGAGVWETRYLNSLNFTCLSWNRTLYHHALVITNKHMNCLSATNQIGLWLREPYDWMNSTDTCCNITIGSDCLWFERLLVQIPGSTVISLLGPWAKACNSQMLQGLYDSTIFVVE